MKNTIFLCTLLSILGFTKNPIYAQKDSIFNSKTAYGISLGYLQGKYKVKTTNWVANGLADTFSGVSQKSQGFFLAIHAQYCFNEKFSIRVQPGFAFDDIQLNFARKDGKSKVAFKENVYFNLPIDIEYTFTKPKNQPIIIAGMRYSRNIQEATRGNLTFFANNIGFETGVGINVGFKKFTARPEILYYFSPFNTLQSENIYAPFKSISTLNRNYLDFRINFFRKTA
jgi:hypothetical protein